MLRSIRPTNAMESTFIIQIPTTRRRSLSLKCQARCTQFAASASRIEKHKSFRTHYRSCRGNCSPKEHTSFMNNKSMLCPLSPGISPSKEHKGEIGGISNAEAQS